MNLQLHVYTLSFYSFVGLKQKIVEKDLKSRMPIKFYMFLPRSCKAVEDDDLKFEYDLEFIAEAHGGSKYRPYKVHVYSVCEKNGEVSIKIQKFSRKRFSTNNKNICETRIWKYEMSVDQTHYILFFVNHSITHLIYRSKPHAPSVNPLEYSNSLYFGGGWC